MKMKSYLMALLAALAVVLAPVTLVTTTGCSWAKVEQGQDPVVVNAERLYATAEDAFDKTFDFEKANRVALGPEVKKSVDEIRKAAPPALDALRAATKAYKQNRSPENKATLETASKVLQALSEQAAKLLAKHKP